MAKRVRPNKKARPTKVKIPKQQRLPEMDDPKVQELQDTALEYAGVRDRRQALTLQEVDLKQELLGIMKKYGKKHYHYKGVDVLLVAESETVKVRIKQEDE